MKVKKLAVLLLCGVLLVSGFSGCGKKQDTKSSDAKSTVAPSEQAQTKNLSEKAINERKASGKYPTIVMAFPTWTGRPAGADRVQEKLSAYAEEKIGVKVKFEIMDIGSYAQSMTLMLSGGEQVDIFNTMNVGYSSMVSKGYCYDLEQDNLIQNYGADTLKTLDKIYVDASRVNGTLYSLPNQRDMAQGLGTYVIPEKYLDGINYDYKSMYANDKNDYISTDINTLNDIYAKLHKAYPDKYVFLPNKTTQLRNILAYDPIGGDAFGVLMDPTNSLEVTNLYESDAFLQSCEQFYNWNQLGYISKDALTDTTTPQQQIAAGTGISTLSSYKPGTKAEQEGQLNGDKVVLFKVLGDLVRSGNVTGMNWCINSGTEDAVAAMQFLNLLYTDPTAANMLAWGEEGVDYVKTDDGFIDYPEGVNSQTAEYSHGMGWMMPNQFITNIFKGNDLNIYKDTIAFNNEAMKSKALGFTFDNSQFMSEYTALTNVYNEYINQIMLGYVEPKAALKEMNDKLYAAGLEKYMTAKKDALKAWADSQGIK